MPFTVNLEYTPFCPQEGLPFTEASFARRSVPFTFEVGEIGVALVDLWNFGWEDGPVSESLGPDLSFERGRSHALRKRQITERVIAPTVAVLRDLGVQIFHCNHGRFLETFPQWQASTTQEERQAHWEKTSPMDVVIPENEHGRADIKDEPMPKHGRHPGWREQHQRLVWESQEWGMKQRGDLYPQLAIPAPVRPKGNDLLVCERDQFHRLLTERGIRVLFYMGFETDCCLAHSPRYGIAKMTGLNCLCTVVRDGTATYEAAETLEGQWRTRVAVMDIEARFGYSLTSSALIESVASAEAVVE